MNDTTQSSSSRPIRRVLLTGALGEVGRRVVPALSEVFDLRRTDLAPDDNTSPEYQSGDLTDFPTVMRLLEGMDAVIHSAAAIPGEPPDDLAPEEVDPNEKRLLSINPIATYNVLEAARRLNLVRVVYVSSLTVVLGNKHRSHYDSRTALCPTNVYACTKFFGEQLAEVYYRNYGLSTISLRLGQPTPIGHPFDEAWMGNRRARSILAHMDDVARGLIAALTTDCPHGVFNLVSANDNPRVDWEETRDAIGYVPLAFCSETGFSFHPDGKYPHHDGSILTHNPNEIPPR